MAHAPEKAETMRVLLHVFAARAAARDKPKKAIQWIKAAANADIALRAIYDDLCAAEPSPAGLVPPIVAKNRLELRNVLDDGAYNFTTTEEYYQFLALEQRAFVALFGLADAKAQGFRLLCDGGLELAGLHFGFED